MKKAFYFLLVLSVISCQQSSKNIVSSLEQKSSNSLFKNTFTNDLEIHESGYSAYLLFDNLTSPEGITFLPKTKEVLVGQSAISNILAFNNQGNVRQFAQIPYDRPCIVDLLNDPIRGIFVVSLYDGKIFLVDHQGNISEFAEGLNYPVFIEMDSKHNLYVSELFGRQITKIDLFGNKTIVVDFKENWDWLPRGLVFDKNEELYVLSDQGVHEIRKFNIHSATNLPLKLSNGKLVASIHEIPYPKDMTFGFDGDLFVLGSNELFRVKLNGQVSKFCSGLVGYYNTINSTKSGNLLFTDYAFAVEEAGKVYSVKRSTFAKN